MSNLIDLQSQIEKLQKQANEIKAKEFASTVQDILAKMQAFGITVKDLQTAKPGKGGKAGKSILGGSKSSSVKLAKASKKATNPVAPKYRGPNGETWSGRGLTPRWLSAQIAEGKNKQDFAVNA
jgi:DNA-binding protein H-NS